MLMGARTRHPRPGAAPADNDAVSSFGAIDGAMPFTAKQGQYLAFIYYCTKIHGVAPAEAIFGDSFV